MKEKERALYSLRATCKGFILTMRGRNTSFQTSNKRHLTEKVSELARQRNDKWCPLAALILINH